MCFGTSVLVPISTLDKTFFFFFRRSPSRCLPNGIIPEPHRSGNEGIVNRSVSFCINSLLGPFHSIIPLSHGQTNRKNVQPLKARTHISNDTPCHFGEPADVQEYINCFNIPPASAKSKDLQQQQQQSPVTAATAK